MTPRHWESAARGSDDVAPRDTGSARLRTGHGRAFELHGCMSSITIDLGVRWDQTRQWWGSDTAVRTRVRKQVCAITPPRTCAITGNRNPRPDIKGGSAANAHLFLHWAVHAQRPSGASLAAPQRCKVTRESRAPHRPLALPRRLEHRLRDAGRGRGAATRLAAHPLLRRARGK